MSNAGMGVAAVEPAGPTATGVSPPEHGLDGTWLAHGFATALHVFTTALLRKYLIITFVGALAFMFNPVCLR